MTSYSTRRDILYTDAAQLDRMANFLRYAADVDLSTMHGVELQDFERTLRAHIKAAMETLLANMPV